VEIVATVHSNVLSEVPNATIAEKLGTSRRACRSWKPRPPVVKQQKPIREVLTEEPISTVLSEEDGSDQASLVRVSNVKNRHLQNDLLTAIICWTNSHHNTAVVAVNSIASLGWKLIEMPEKYEVTSCNSIKR